jgi:hypothetical protein
MPTGFAAGDALQQARPFNPGGKRFFCRIDADNELNLVRKSISL